MIKGARVPEQAYRIVLWVVSLVFAGFIIGLGNLVIGDLPLVEQQAVPDRVIESPRAPQVRRELDEVHTQQGQINDKLEIERLQLDHAKTASEAGSDSFHTWIEARTATTNPQQDPEVLARTHALEQLKGNERTIQTAINDLESQQLPLNQRETALEAEQGRLGAQAEPMREKALFGEEMRVFLLRLAITLPMLLVAGWLTLKKRQSEYWPLARGFVISAIFVFFVELVPYLPSYGGYVRYGVGIVGTLIVGHFLIRNMRSYLAKRQAAEQQGEEERRKLVSHDEAFKKMAAKVCPGCDRPIASMDGTESNFCVHCGMTLFDHCSHCETRKMAFFRYCLACGTPALNV